MNHKDAKSGTPTLSCHEIIPEDGKSGGDRYWHISRIRMSPVCIVVEVTAKPAPGSNDAEERKQTLYSLLKGISLRAMDRNLRRPMVGFIDTSKIQNTPLNDAMKTWVADQDWHQGDFILYLTDGSQINDARRTTPVPEELLLNIAQVLKANTHRQRKTSEIFEAIGSQFNDFSKDEKTLCDRLQKIVYNPDEDIDSSENKNRLAKETGAWKDDIFGQAKKIGGEI